MTIAQTSTTAIARRHGHTGPTACQDCGTTENLHFGSWFNPATGESGDFLQCCACGIAAGDPICVHAECEPREPDDDDEELKPAVRVFRREAGWAMTTAGPEPCTTNHFREQDGRPLCMDTAVWKVVEDHGLHLSIGFYCDADLPAERRRLTADAA